PLQLARPPSKSLRTVDLPARKLFGAQAAPPPRRHPSGPLCCARHAPDNGLTLQAPPERRFVQGIRYNRLRGRHERARALTSAPAPSAPAQVRRDLLQTLRIVHVRGEGRDAHLQGDAPALEPATQGLEVPQLSLRPLGLLLRRA